jgi:toxin ParE1/3/4
MCLCSVGGTADLIIYLERDTRLDIWRVLHAQRDVPAWMGQGEFQ